MHPLLSRTARATLSAIVALCWLLAANHCVVAGLLPRAAAPAGEHQECPGHPAPKDDGQSRDCDGSGCCKALSAPVALSKNLVGYDLAIFGTSEFPLTQLAAAPQMRAGLILELDTGPPDASSFAESVLQRSILAHAPPSVA